VAESLSTFASHSRNLARFALSHSYTLTKRIVPLPLILRLGLRVTSGPGIKAQMQPLASSCPFYSASSWTAKSGLLDLLRLAQSSNTHA
jgi:hypothetical protein